MTGIKQYLLHQALAFLGVLPLTDQRSLVYHIDLLITKHYNWVGSITRATLSYKSTERGLRGLRWLHLKAVASKVVTNWCLATKNLAHINETSTALGFLE